MAWDCTDVGRRLVRDTHTVCMYYRHSGGAGRGLARARRSGQCGGPGCCSRPQGRAERTYVRTSPTNQRPEKHAARRAPPRSPRSWIRTDLAESSGGARLYAPDVARTTLHTHCCTGTARGKRTALSALACRVRCGATACRASAAPRTFPSDEKARSAPPGPPEIPAGGGPEAGPAGPSARLPFTR